MANYTMCWAYSVSSDIVYIMDCHGEEEHSEEEVPKSSRGRRTVKKTIPPHQEKVSPVKKTATRGRKPKASTEETPKAEETPRASIGRRGRAKASVVEDLEQTITKPPPQAQLAALSEEEEPAKEVVVSTKKGRGRKKVEPVAVEKDPIEKPAPAKPVPARKGRAKKAVEPEEEQKELEPEPKKRGRRAAVAEEVSIRIAFAIDTAANDH